MRGRDLWRWASYLVGRADDYFSVGRGAELLDLAAERVEDEDDDDEASGHGNETRAVGATAIRLLRGLQEIRDGLEAQTALMVAAARAAGVPWSAIGKVLGMTAQGAQQRYGDDVRQLHAINDQDDLLDWTYAVRAPRTRRAGPRSP